MKTPQLWMITLATLTLSACQTTPNSPTQALGVLEHIEDIQVHPSTQSNSIQLVKAKDHCAIEFAAKLNAGTASEKWLFKGNALMAASNQVITTEGATLGEKFDLYDPSVQRNFVALKSHFKKETVNACQ
jgi:hypothetical protein